jgi:four helix bundle protein
MEKIRTYRDLLVWQRAMQLVQEVYALTRCFPVEEKFGLVSQMNRAAVSVPANIAEGWGRLSTKNYLQFLRTSRGSLFELETLLLIACGQQFAEEAVTSALLRETDELSRMLGGLIKSLEAKLTP